MKSATGHSGLMDADTENNIRLEQVESFGRLMAGFSHDMKNHLGTIREANGLMSDLIAMAGSAADEPFVQRLSKAIASIENRVIVAADMLHHLSSLAHRSDTPSATFQVNDLVTEECAFLERFSRLKQVTCKLDLGEGLPVIYNEPSLLQHVFYRMHGLCLELLSAGDSLVVVTREYEKAIQIVFRLSCPQEGIADLLTDTLQAAIQKLGGRLETEYTTQGITDVVLTIPPLTAV
ncbi:MAG: hypothetical protein ACN4GW_12320 [Desulforhopalus sp.]